MAYPPDIRVIRVMCTGRVDPAIVAEAFVNGADGVMVIGCHFGDCHYISGNLMAKEKLDVTGQTLSYAGMNPNRLIFVNLSSAEAARFVRFTTDFVSRIRKIGPLGNGDRLKLPALTKRLEIARLALAGPKLRWLMGKKPVFTTEGNKYGEVFTEHEINRTISGLIIDEMATHGILSILEKRAASVSVLAEEANLAPPDAFKYILALKRRGLVEMDHVEGTSPIYRRRLEEGRC